MMITPDQEKEWIANWPVAKHQVMEQLYKACFDALWKTAFRILRDQTSAEDMVQEVMIRVWQMERLDHIATSLSGYLHRGVLNRSLNKLREQHRWEIHEKAPELGSREEYTFEPDTDRMEKNIEKAIAALPDRCRLVFVLSRYEYLTYQEIADIMEISIKTVENQMSKALKLLKEQLLPLRIRSADDNQPTI